MAGDVCGQVIGFMCQNKEFVYNYSGSGDPLNIFPQGNGTVRG